MSSPDRFLTLPDLDKEYAGLGEWFNDPRNLTAQMQGQNRLKSAEEKMKLVGGEDKIRETSDSLLKQWKSHYLVLQACRDEAMVAPEITRFASIVGVKINTVNANLTAHSLMQQNQLIRVSGLVYISREQVKPDNPELFKVHQVAIGYLTTRYGLTVMERRVRTKGKNFVVTPPTRTYRSNFDL